MNIVTIISIALGIILGNITVSLFVWIKKKLKKSKRT